MYALWMTTGQNGVNCESFVFDESFLFVASFRSFQHFCLLHIFEAGFDDMITVQCALSDEKGDQGGNLGALKIMMSADREDV